MVCSKEHLKYLLQDGHKRYCGLPPFRSPFSEDDNALCREVLGKDDINNQLENENAKDDNKDRECIEEEEDEGDDNDDGSWESVESDEGLEHDKRTKNDQIFSFFNEKSYKFQQREAHPFSNLY